MSRTATPSEPVLCWQPCSQVAERRLSHRLPLPADVCVTGLDEQLRPTGASVRVRGRDISVEGASFYHSHPLPERFAAISYKTGRGIETVVLRLSWCRYFKPGSYLSGGKLIRSDLALNLPADWSELADG
jgi:hypothetical protein